MSITNENSATTLNGNSSATSWPFTLKCFDEGDIKITRIDADDVDTVLVLDTDYSIALNADQNASPGGTITYPLVGSALPTGEFLLVERDIPLEQNTTISNTGFYPHDTEEMADRNLALLQQLKRLIDRCIKIPSSMLSSTTTLLAKGDIAGKVIVGNAAGTAFELSDSNVLDLDVPVAAAAASAVTASAAAATATAAAATATTKAAEAAASAALIGADTHVSAYLNAHQALTGPGTNVAQFNAEDYDALSEFDIATNKGRFTATTTGYYHFAVKLMFGAVSMTAGEHVSASLRVGGSTHKTLGYWHCEVTGTPTFDIHLVKTLYLTAGQYVEVTVSPPSNMNLYSGASSSCITIDRML